MEEPLRYHRTFGLDAEQLDELEARIEDILPDPWDKGTGRPKSLSLREAIMITLLYKRQNMVEEVIADLFGVSQGTVSEIITEFTPLIAQAHLGTEGNDRSADTCGCPDQRHYQSGHGRVTPPPVLVTEPAQARSRPPFRRSPPLRANTATPLRSD
jgi:predicted XRE-type DNA-binding protein